MQPNEYVQPIVVAVGADHVATIAAAAAASVTAAANTDPQLWKAWLAGRFTKTVRRAKPGPWQRLAADADAVTVVGDARAAAWAPCTYANLDVRISKLQVSGTNFARTARPEAARNSSGLHLLVADTLTTGKACAQAAHAAWLWALHAEDANLTGWYDNPDVHIHLCADVAAEELPLTVVDAGLTEVDPGTTTAAAWWNAPAPARPHGQ